mmetsp:Transcript_53884/g.66039  ORF Transcript_53884/g.66039 Transcript_53884/m.66039 type:complete len:321 (+) Transcript_53884:521-1483(+)
MLLNVRDAEHDHAKDVHRNPNCCKDVVLSDVSLCSATLHSKKTHEGDGIIAAQETPVAVGQHEAEEIMTNVSSRQVCGLNQVIVKDVVPMRQGDEHSSWPNVFERSFIVAEVRLASEDTLNLLGLGLMVTEKKRIVRTVGRGQTAAVVHACQVRNVQDHPAGQPRTCIPESLQVKWHLQNAMKQTRIADHAHEEIVKEVLVVENAVILFKLGIIHMAFPKDAEVHIQPQRHDVASDHSLSQKSSHVLEDVVGLQNSIGAQEEQPNVAQEKAQQTVHGVDQLAAALQHHTFFELPRQNHFTQCLATYPCQRDNGRTPDRTD